MKNIPPLIVPADLDLGNIAGVKVGDELAVIHTRSGTREVSCKLIQVREVASNGLVRCGKAGAFWLKYGGANRYFMNYGVYFYSVNPAHIAEAKEKAETAERERIAKETEHKRKMKICLPIGEIFGDGSPRYDSGGCYYETKEVAETLMEKLNDEQLKQLAEWLGVKI